LLTTTVPSFYVNQDRGLKQKRWFRNIESFLELCLIAQGFKRLCLRKLI